MIQLAKIILKILPWLMVVGLMSWMLIEEKFSGFLEQGQKETVQSTILTRVEQIGKLELVKYNFQEVTEIKKIADSFDFKLFKYKPLPDAKAVLISQGVATGCIDLSRLTAADLSESGDTLYISLPQPELCYFKLDLEKSRMYDLQIQYMSDEDKKNFIEQLYKVAEAQIRESAMQTGILDQTQENAQLILKPMLENMTGKKVMIGFQMSDVEIPRLIE